MRRETIGVHLALFSVSLIYAISYTLSKEVMPEWLLPRGFILFRLVGALLILIPFQLFWVREKVRGWKTFGHLALCALFGVCANMLLFFEGLAITSPIDASLIMVTTPILVYFGSWIARHESLSRQKIIGIAIGTVGAMALIGLGNRGSAASSTLGNYLVFINAAFYAVYLILVKGLMKRFHPITVVTYVFLIGSVMVAPFGIPQLAIVEWGALPQSIWLILIFTVVFVTFFTYYLNAFALKKVPTSVVGAYVYIQPALSTLIAVASGKYHLIWQHVVFGALIFAGVYVINKKPRAIA